ncbi:MAG: triose-phosphate isomerase [Oceanicola sp.]|nr:triose-phosphate isomerase [Oceanicola sp.]
MARKLAAGNWKMNGTVINLPQIAEIAGLAVEDGPEVLICPPAPMISRAADAARGTQLAIGGQDCHVAEKGAHTGDIAAEMLRDAGATYVILGHSERRTDHGETSALVLAKAQAAQRAGLTPIVCVGETFEERQAGLTLEVVRIQLASSIPATDAPLVVAYEPVWAIGTGLVPTSEQIAEVHADMRARLALIDGVKTADVPLLYGGSVNAENAATVFAVPEVDGALVGGASLKPADFAAIVAALSAS